MSSGLYADISDEDLVTKIRAFRDARDELAGGGMVAKVQGEGRMVEYVRSDITGSSKALNTALRNYLAEAARRGLPIGDGLGGAILVEIG